MPSSAGAEERHHGEDYYKAVDRMADVCQFSSGPQGSTQQPATMWTKAVSYATLLGLLVAQATATCTRDIRSILLEDGNTWSARTTITFPEDGAAFNNVTGRWSIYAAPTYAAAISPGTEEDVIKAVCSKPNIVLACMGLTEADRSNLHVNTELTFWQLAAATPLSTLSRDFRTALLST